MRHPSEYFIKFLISQQHQNALDDKWVTIMVESLGFPPPEQEYLRALRTVVYTAFPSNYEPTNRYNRETVKYLKTQGIHGLHNPSEAVHEATRIVTHLKARPLIENLLLGRIEAKEIAKKINARLSEFFTIEGIEAYAHYYWNVSLLKVEDWVKLLDKYKVEKSNTVSIVQVGPAMALHKSGFRQQVDSKTVLQEMQEAVFFDFKEWKTQPMSKDRTRAYATLAKTAAIIDERMAEADSALKDSLKAFEQFRMQHAQHTVPDVKKVAIAGNFTGSGAKLLDAHKEEE